MLTAAQEIDNLVKGKPNGWNWGTVGRGMLKAPEKVLDVYEYVPGYGQVIRRAREVKSAVKEYSIGEDISPIWCQWKMVDEVSLTRYMEVKNLHGETSWERFGGGRKERCEQ